MYYVGIDWANDHHDIAILDDRVELLDQFRIEHSTEGFQKLTERINKITSKASEIACIIETNNGLLVAYLLESGYNVYPVNPSTLDRKRKPSGAKTDRIDAYLLARHGRNDLDELTQLKPDNPLIEELRILTRDQSNLIQQQTRLTNQLCDCLKSYYPVALNYFSGLNQPITIAFLEKFPTVTHVKNTHPEVLVKFLKEHKHPFPHETAQKIISLSKARQLPVKSSVTRTKSRLMLTLIRQLKALGEDIKLYDKEIEKLFFAHADSELFLSLPAVGVRQGARLLSEFGDDRNRFTNCEGVAALAGTSPVPKSSGKTSHAVKRFACVKPFRNTMYQLAWCSITKEPWAKEYYYKKRAEGKSHSVALRALSNVWIRIIYAIWINKEQYDRTKFIAAQAKHKLRAA